MATVAQSLFGVTPESLQQERQNALMNRAVQVAQLDPFQQAYASIYAGVGNLGRGIGGLLGAEDPELMRVRQRQELLQDVNPTDPASLRAAAQKAMERKDYQAAQMLADRAMSAETEQAKLESERALANQRNRERIAADPVQQIIRTGKYTPASVAAYQQSGNISDLEPIDKGDPTALSETKEGIFLVNKNTGDKIARIGDAPARGTSVNVSVKQDEAVTKSNVEAFGSLRDRAITSGTTLEAVKSIKPLIDRSFAGFGSNVKLTAAQIADAFGVPISGASETEQLRSLQNNLKIGNSTVLKGAISDKDMAILGEAIGQGTVTKEGLRGIINNIEKDALITQREYQLANEYQQGGKLSQYDFVAGSSKARKEVNDKLKRLRELEQKAQQGAR